MTPRVNNATAASLLGFLHHGPMSGWDLATVAQSVIGDFWSLSTSQIYRELERMAAAGLIESSATQARNRRPYALTEAGREAFAAWIDQEPGGEQIRFPLLLTVSFGRHLPDGRLREFVEHHRQAHAARLSEYEDQYAQAAASADPDPYALATLEFGLLYERAVMEWFDRLVEQLPDRSRE